MKRTADEVSDLELPEGSRPMLALDRTRHRPANPQPNLVEQPSTVTPLQAAAVTPPASSDPRRSDPTVHTSFISAIRVPVWPCPQVPFVQSMLREAWDKRWSEGRQEIQATLDEAESEVKELRRRLDPENFKGAYDRGFREGGKKVYDMCKLQRETEANEDRLAF